MPHEKNNHKLCVFGYFYKKRTVVISCHLVNLGFQFAKFTQKITSSTDNLTANLSTLSTDILLTISYSVTQFNKTYLRQWRDLNDDDEDLNDEQVL